MSELGGTESSGVKGGGDLTVDSNDNNGLMHRRSHRQSLTMIDNPNLLHTTEVFVRTGDECNAMAGRDRRRHRFRRFFSGGDKVVDTGRTGGASPSSRSLNQGLQFRLTSKKVTSSSTLRRICDNITTLCCCGSSYMNEINKRTTSAFCDPNQLLVDYLYWMFRTNFIVLFIYSAFNFYLLVVIFAAFIVAAGRLDGDCVKIGGQNVGHTGTWFSDAFALSWTTFSTVGYGSSYPALSGENDNPNHCSLITTICSIESFVGVLYAGFCGAILFGKVLRIQSHAQVVFSDPMIVRYGSGIDAQNDDDEQEDHDDHDDDDDDDDDEMTHDDNIAKTPQSSTLFDSSSINKMKKKQQQQQQQQQIPCPVLEFRLANRLHGEVGGEIMDAVLHAIAVVNSDDADPLLRNEVEEPRKNWYKAMSQKITSLGSHFSPMSLSNFAAAAGGSSRSGDIETGKSHSLHKIFNNSTSNTTTSNTTSNTNTNNISATTKKEDSRTTSTERERSRLNTQHILMHPFSFMGGHRDHQAVDEDPASSIAPKLIFSNILIEASDHPFFKRVWLARHILDETSPLLTARARKLVRRNGGYWPESLNSADAVRDSLQFNQIIVSVSGVSNVSASDVYAQKIYDFVDLVVGYQFVNVLYRGPQGNLRVDLDILNDVTEQKGGGGEPLGVTD